MAYTLTGRFSLPQWNEDSDILNRAQLTGAFANIASLAAQDVQGTLAARPAPGVVGRYYQSTSESGGYRLYRDTGTFWQEILCHVDRAGPAVSRPVPGNAGSYYYESDQHRLYRDSGTVWEELITSVSVPAGTIVMTAAVNLPTGWLWCDGSTQSPSVYPDLYRAIGTTYGGNSTAFRTPNMVEVIPTGSASIPNPGTLNKLRTSGVDVNYDFVASDEGTYRNDTGLTPSVAYTLGINFLIKAN